MSGNLRLKGSERVRDIMRGIESYRALNTKQIEVLFFNNEELFYSKRKSQEIMLKLFKAGRLNRKMIDDYYCYFLDNQPGMLKHLIDTNWVRMWFELLLHKWEKIHSWSYEQDYKILRCDGFVAIKNTIKGTYRFAFIEMDRGTNNFDKVEKYNKLYESDKLNHSWFFELTERFPMIQVVTLDQHRKKLIQSKIEGLNSNGLEFKVILLHKVKREVLKCLVSNGRTE